jgi:hypothetical protein
MYTGFLFHVNIFINLFVYFYTYLLNIRKGFEMTMPIAVSNLNHQYECVNIYIYVYIIYTELNLTAQL